MNHAPETTTDADNSGDFDPRRAADLLDQATRQARRTFTPFTPGLLIFRAILLLVVFGGIWLSVRGQHPYSVPTGSGAGIVLLVTLVLVIINIGWSAAQIGRASTGISGPAQRKWRIWLGVMLVAWIAAYAALAPGFHAEVTHPVWGLYPASGPPLIIGLVGAVTAAALRDWRIAGFCLTLAAVAAAAGFGGPTDEWLIMAIGLCAVMLGTAALTAWGQRRRVIRP